MLVLTCRPGDVIEIGDGIRVKLLESGARGSKVGIEAPREVEIHKRSVLRGLKEAAAAVTKHVGRTLPLLALTLGLTMASGVGAQAVDVSGCPTVGAQLFTQFDPGGFYPMRVAGVPVGGYMYPDEAAAGACVCPGKFGWPTPGITYGQWLPERIVETVRGEFCSPTLGGSLGGSVSALDPRRGGGTSDQAGKGHGTFLNIHVIAYPAAQVAGSLLASCSKGASSSTAPLWISEIDPTWRSEALMALTTPEALLFANPLAIEACVADAVASTAYKPIELMFWCAGSWGTIYPDAGFSDNPGSTVVTHSLTVAKTLAMMQKRMMIPRSYGQVAVCMNVPWPTLLKQQYKLQQLYPMREMTEHWIGAATMAWGEWRSPPIGGSDFATLVWQWSDCCENF